MGWEAKSKGTRYRPWWAEREGLRDYARIWLRVSSAWGIKSCQRLGGKVMWAEEKTAMTWFLAVRIARSAGLERGLKGGTYWILEGEADRKEERSEVRRSFVVKKKMC